ncbi:mechanosensitive ion channel family protein [Xenophilus arseniciresistens]|uniref:mechanosensitive ion channel family protein n=1 Tax=Xenophilus arseniciresistens TaxID=1283306 RepID=UPI0038CD86D0
MNEFGFQVGTLRGMLFQIGAFIPRLLIAAAVLVAGWLLAKVVRFAVTRALRAVNFPVLTERAGLDGFLRQGGMKMDTTGIVGVLAYWMVILAALIVAFNGLGLSYVTDLLGRVVWFVPNIFVALLVLAFGAYFARFVADAVLTYGRNVGLRDAYFFSRLAQYGILIFVVLIALDQVKVGGDIVRQSFIVILAGFVFAVALAFGLAGKDWAARRIDEWLPRDGMPHVDGGAQRADAEEPAARVAEEAAELAAGQPPPRAAAQTAAAAPAVPVPPADTAAPTAPAEASLPRREPAEPLIPRRVGDPPPPI